MIYSAPANSQEDGRKIPPVSQSSLQNASPVGIRVAAPAVTRKALARAGAAMIRVVGHPGCGKTGLMEATLKRLRAPRRAAVIVVNPAASRDALRLQNLCGHVGHINAAAPTASVIWRVLKDLNLADFDLVMVESAGGLTSIQDIGQDATAAIFSVGSGDDKAAEYHALLKASSVVVVSKYDLRPHVAFDVELFSSEVRAINPLAELHTVSAVSGDGLDGWIDWLERMRLTKQRQSQSTAREYLSSDSFFG
jgi:hydrogenase nickel incorporation protein HypB